MVHKQVALGVMVLEGDGKESETAAKVEGIAEADRIAEFEGDSFNSGERVTEGVSEVEAVPEPSVSKVEADGDSEGPKDDTIGDAEELSEIVGVTELLGECDIDFVQLKLWLSEDDAEAEKVIEGELLTEVESELEGE